MLPGIIPQPQVNPLTYAYASSAGNSSTLTTYTFSSQAIGTAAPTRRVLVGSYGGNTTALRTISSVTIGGVAATLVAQDTLSSTVLINEAFYWAPVPTGTTANIVVTYSGSQLQAGIAVWAVYDAIGNFNVSNSSTAAPMDLSLTPTFSNSALFAICRSASSATFTWTGLSEDADFLIGTVGMGAASSYRPNPGNLSITSTASASAVPFGFSVAIY